MVTPDKRHVSVVIPVLNEAGKIARCIDGILDQSLPPDEIIVIDSGSTDGTLEILAGYPSVKVISITRGTFNHGETRNLGARSASSEWVIFTVGDARPADRTWIEKLFDGLMDADVAAVCGAQIVPHEKAANPAEWFRPVSAPQLKRVQFSSAAEFDALSPEQKLSACSWDDVTALYKREALLRIPFQRTIFAEDAMWAADALRAGLALVYNPAARVFHYHQESPDFTFRRTIAVMYHRFTTFGYLHNEPDLAAPMLRAAAIIARADRLTLGERLSWTYRAWSTHLAARRAIRTFRSAALSGSANVDALHRRYCSTPPAPEKTQALRTA